MNWHRLARSRAPLSALFGLGVATGLLLGQLASPAASRAQDDDAAQIEMVVGLLKGDDRDMRALALQYVRGELAGEKATRQFAAILPDLAPDAQAVLIEALGERGDATARADVLKMLESETAAVRAAALGALGALGGADDVPLLAKHAAEGSEAEKSAAQKALKRLRGDGVDDAILAALKDAEPARKAALLGVLAARNARQALPDVFAAAADADGAVRLAALGALRLLADESNTADVVATLKAATNESERAKAELALLVVCSRGREACVDALVEGLSDADAKSQAALLRALGRAGGTKALEAIVQRIGADDETVRDEAVRILSIWNDPAAMAHLVALAEKAEEPRHQVLAVRGMIQLAAAAGERPADVAALTKALALAKRLDEKRLAVAALSGAPTAEALAVVSPLLGDAQLGEEAALAAVLIAEKMPRELKDQAKAALEQVVAKTKRDATRQRAEKAIQSLDKES